MDAIHHLTSSFGGFAGAHPVITMIGAFAVGFVLGRIPLGRKKAAK